ncbi:MAG: SRPBCC family protein [Pirellulales bacterium]
MRAGGEFSFVVERAGHTLDHTGTYLEIARPTRLSFTWGMREQLPETSRVDITLSPVAGGCELTLTHEMGAQWADYVERVTNSWTMMLEKLAIVLDPASAR